MHIVTFDMCDDEFRGKILFMLMSWIKDKHIFPFY